jgi:hypothetical protein
LWAAITAVSFVFHHHKCSELLLLQFLFVAAEIIIYQCGCYVLFFDGYLWFSALIDIMVRLISSGILSPSFASRNKNYVLFLVLSKQKII